MWKFFFGVVVVVPAWIGHFRVKVRRCVVVIYKQLKNNHNNNISKTQAKEFPEQYYENKWSPWLLTIKCHEMDSLQTIDIFALLCILNKRFCSTDSAILRFLLFVKCPLFFIFSILCFSFWLSLPLLHISFLIPFINFFPHFSFFYWLFLLILQWNVRPHWIMDNMNKWNSELN